MTGPAKVTVTASAWYDIEAGYDYLYAEYSTDGGANWTPVGAPVDGIVTARWKTLRYSYTAPAASKFRFRYATDGGVHLAGAFLDNIAIKSATGTITDDVEARRQRLDRDGRLEDQHRHRDRSRSSTTSSRTAQYVGYDATLAHGPVQVLRGLHASPNWVELFPFQHGMLVWYVDERYDDNNTSSTRAAALALPVDARPAPFTLPRRHPAEQPSPAVRRDVRPGGHRRRACTRRSWSARAEPDGAGRSRRAHRAARASPTFDDTEPLRYWSVPTRRTVSRSRVAV